MTSSSCGRSRPGLARRHHDLGGRREVDAVQIVVEQLRRMPGAALSHVVHVRGEMRERGRTRSSAAAEPPTMTVSVPVSAALAPPEMPASRYSTPRSARAARGSASSRPARTCSGRRRPGRSGSGSSNAVRAQDDRLDDGAVGQREEDDVGSSATRALDDCGGRRGRRLERGRHRGRTRGRSSPAASQAPSDPAAHVPEPDDAEGIQCCEAAAALLEQDRDPERCTPGRRSC